MKFSLILQTSLYHFITKSTMDKKIFHMIMTYSKMQSQLFHRIKDRIIFS